jgi:hypothetical protein
MHWWKQFVSGYVCFSDEATFHLCDKVNKHNCRIWGYENPYVVLEHEKGEVFCWPDLPWIKVSMWLPSPTLPQWSPRFLGSNISLSAFRKRRADYLATQVTGLALCGFVKNVKYQQRVQNMQELGGRITNAEAHITPNMLEDTWLSFGLLPSNKVCTLWDVLANNVNLESFITIPRTLHTNK